MKGDRSLRRSSTAVRTARRGGLRRGLRDGFWALLVFGVLAAVLGAVGEDDAQPGVRVVAQFPTEPSERLARLVAGESPPSVVFVLTDDQNTDEMEWMPRTRRLLQGEGVTFSENVSPHPLCCPARAELLTGQYAQNNGVQHNGGPFGGIDALAPSYPMLQQRFAAAGYRTGLVGKYLNGYGAAGQPRQSGWDLWKPLTRGVYTYDRFSFAGEPGAWRQDRRPYVTHAISRRTDDAVRELSADGDPFMLFSWHVAPHYRPGERGRRPPPAAPRDRGLFEDVDAPSLRKPSYNQADVDDQPLPIRVRPLMRDQKNERMFRGRIRSLQAVDRSVASLVRTLRQTDELDNTYIVFASDNGFAMGEHRLFGKNVLTQPILDVPLVVRGPGLPRGTVSSVPSSLVDLPATLLDLAGVEDRDGVDGTSLVGPALDVAAEFRDTTLVQTGGAGHDGWKYRGVRTRRYLYAYDANADDGVLYDHARDPHQLHNRFADPAYAPVVEELESRAARLRECSGADCNLRFGFEPTPDAP